VRSESRGEIRAFRKKSLKPPEPPVMGSGCPRRLAWRWSVAGPGDPPCEGSGVPLRRPRVISRQSRLRNGQGGPPGSRREERCGQPLHSEWDSRSRGFGLKKHVKGPWPSASVPAEFARYRPTRSEMRRKKQGFRGTRRVHILGERRRRCTRSSELAQFLLLDFLSRFARLAGIFLPFPCF
jgi:hypothetical protein